MRVCCRCKQNKPDNEFGQRATKKAYACKACKRSYDKIFYQKTIKTRREHKLKNQAAIRKRNKKYIKDFLTGKSCVDCGNKDIRVLEFDHVRGKKEFNISDGHQDCMSIEKIQREIDKCEVRCANCHRIVTRNRM